MTDGHVLGGERAGLHEEAHEAEADAVLLLEQILVAGAGVDHRRHVDVVERRQHRRGVLRFLEALGDRLAKPRHLDALFAFSRSPAKAGAQEAEPLLPGQLALSPPAPGPRPAPGNRFLRLGRRDHVVLGQAAVLAGAPDAGRVDMMFEDRAAHRGGQGGHGRVLRRPVGVRDLRRMIVAAQRRRFARAGRVGGRVRGGLRRCRRSRGRAFVDPRDHRADRDSVAFLDELLGQHARDRRRHFDADLVGLEAGDRLVFGDRLARLLQPLRERAFGDRFPERRDLDVSGHSGSLLRRAGDCRAAMA